MSNVQLPKATSFGHSWATCPSSPIWEWKLVISLIACALVVAFSLTRWVSVCCNCKTKSLVYEQYHHRRTNNDISSS